MALKIAILILLVQVTENHAQEPDHKIYPVYNRSDQIPFWAGIVATLSSWFRSYIYVDHTGILTTDGNFYPWDEYNHFPNQVSDYQLHVPTPGSRYVNGTKSVNQIPDVHYTPDFRLPQSPLTGRQSAEGWKLREVYRYYRVNTYKWLKRFDKENDEYEALGLFPCYGALVYKRLHTLAMTAQLSYKHIMTTALATDMVVKRYKRRKTLDNILGWWYGVHNDYAYNNNNYYATPARIHYHHRWNRPELLNRSFPIPCVFDVAVLTSTTHCIYKARLCHRACPGFLQGANRPPILVWKDRPIIIVIQSVLEINRKPFPWFKYVFKIDHERFDAMRYPCPKTEWGWFLCLELKYPTGKFGLDSGAMLHTGTERKGFFDLTRLPGVSLIGIDRYKGLLAMNSFSMRLRSKSFVNYFTILDTHPVLDFLYAAFMGRLPYAYLDSRFENTQWYSPYQKVEGGQNLYNWHETTPIHYGFRYNPKCW